MLLGAGVYPITIAEMHSYSRDADRVFKKRNEEHEHLKEFLALHPEYGDIIPGANGVRKLGWPIKKASSAISVRVIYFFRDLNMPLYLLAMYEKGERIDISAEACKEISLLVDQLIEEHSKSWGKIFGRYDIGKSL